MLISSSGTMIFCRKCNWTWKHTYIYFDQYQELIEYVKSGYCLFSNRKLVYTVLYFILTIISEFTKTDISILISYKWNLRIRLVKEFSQAKTARHKSKRQVQNKKQMFYIYMYISEDKLLFSILINI